MKKKVWSKSYSVITLSIDKSVQHIGISDQVNLIQKYFIYWKGKSTFCFQRVFLEANNCKQERSCLVVCFCSESGEFFDKRHSAVA